MKRAAAALFKLRMAQEVARRLSVWRHRQLHSALELSRARASSTMYYRKWEAVLVRWNGGVRVVDFYYSNEARLAAAEGLQEGLVADGQQPGADEDVFSELGTQTEGQQLEAVAGKAEADSAVEAEALSIETEGQQLGAAAGESEADNIVEDAAVQRAYTKMSWRRWCKRWCSHRGLERAARGGKEEQQAAAGLGTTLDDAAEEDQGGGGDAVVPGTEGQQLEATLDDIEAGSTAEAEKMLGGWLQDEVEVWERGESVVEMRLAQQYAQRACAAVRKEQAARMCPVTRSGQTPQHRPGV